MLRHASGSTLRAADRIRAARTSISTKLLASQSQIDTHIPKGRRSFAISSVNAARGVLRENERQVLSEINELRRTAMVHDVGVDGISKADSTLPAVTEEMLDSVYGALKVPDPPTEEDQRLEQRRLRALELEEEGSGRIQKLEARARTRLTQALARLEKMEAFMQRFQLDEDADHVSDILAMIKVRDTEDTVVDTAETETSMRSGDDLDIQRHLPEVEVETSFEPAMQPSNVLKAFGRSLTVLREVGKAREDVPIVPQALFSLRDWESVSRLSVSTGDVASVLKVFKLMKECGFTTMRTRVANVAMDVFASQGNAEGLQTILSLMLDEGIDLDGYSRHCVVKCYTKARRHEEAISVLQSFESSTPAPMATYTLLIASLLRLKSVPRLQAKVWPIFNQMRMQAHPTPDAPLYAHMITACALGVPQPNEEMWQPALTQHALAKAKVPERLVKKTRPSHAERALDLFREMTLRYQVRPTPEVYASVISACAGRRKFYHTAIAIFKSMLEYERERLEADQSEGPSFAPTRATFNALLRGCARNGDLKRARWILAEMLRGTGELISALHQRGTVHRHDILHVNKRRPDVETVTSLLYAYANYEMPGKANELQTRQASQEDEDGISFSESVPRSAARIVSEVEGLLERIITDQGRPDGMLSSVKPNTAVMSAYIAVLSRWAPGAGLKPWTRARSVLFGSTQTGTAADAAVDEELPFGGESLYERWALPIDEKTCKAVVELCEGISNKSRQDKSVDWLGDTVWQRWRATAGRAGSGLDIVGGDQQPFSPVAEPGQASQQDVSDCWAGMIRQLAKGYRLEESMALLREFVQLYPPRNHFGDQSERITGDVANLQYYQSNVGGFERPALTKLQVDVLSQRLKAQLLDGNATEEDRNRVKKDIKFIVWAVKAYEKDVRPRMPDVLINAERYVERYQRPGQRPVQRPVQRQRHGRRA